VTIDGRGDHRGRFAPQGCWPSPARRWAIDMDRLSTVSKRARSLVGHPLGMTGRPHTTRLINYGFAQPTTSISVSNKRFVRRPAGRQGMAMISSSG